MPQLVFELMTAILAVIRSCKPQQYADNPTHKFTKPRLRTVPDDLPRVASRANNQTIVRFAQLIAHHDLPGAFLIPGKNVKPDATGKQVGGHVRDIFFRQEAWDAKGVEFGPCDICLDDRLKPLQHNDVHTFQN